MTGFVYKWINTINGKWYIGSHKGTTDDGYRHTSEVMKFAEEKYGLDLFKREILFEGDYEKDKIRDVESNYLRKENAANNSMSYNRTNITGPNCFSERTRHLIGKNSKRCLQGKSYEEILGSKEAADQKKKKIIQANTGRKHPPRTKEQRNRLSLAQKEVWRKNSQHGMSGKRHSEETKNVLSEIRKARPSPGMTGKHHSLETRQKIGAYSKGKSLNASHRLKIRESLLEKRWYTDGKRAIFVDKNTAPRGFIPGRKIK